MTTMTKPLPRETKRNRLERAGYAHVSCWVPLAYARRVMAQAEAHREEIERVLAEPARPRGRPRKS